MRTGSHRDTEAMVPRARFDWRRLRPPYWRRRTGWALGAVLIGAALVTAGISHLHPSSGPALPPARPSAPPVSLTLGHPFTLLTPLRYVDGLDGAVSITPITVTRATPAAGVLGGSNTDVTVRVCAGSEPVSPALLLGPDLTLRTGSDLLVTAGDDTATSPTLEATLQPGRCATGTQGFYVPGGAPVTQVDFDLGQPLSATWTV